MTTYIFALAALIFVFKIDGASAQNYPQQNIPSSQQYKRPSSQQAAQPKPTPTPTPTPAPQPRPTVRRVVAKPAPVKVVGPQKPLLSLAPTHILPSAFILPGGSFFIGTGAAFGVGNLFDISTNVYGDIEQVYNVMVKFGVLKGKNLALSAWLEYTSQTEQYSGVDPNTGLTGILTTNFSSIDPGFTLSYRLGRRFTAHTGGNVAIQTPVITKASLSQRTSFIQGNTVHQEFTVGLSDDLAMSFGGSYDVTYDIWGAGVSFHIDAIQLGAHYYLNVAQGSFLPIIGGSFPSISNMQSHVALR